MPDTAAIVVAGGQGTRFGGKVRKQYLTLEGRPILWWSLKAFENSPSVDAIVLVVPESDVARLERQVKTWRLKKARIVVAGGKSRRESVAKGLQVVPPDLKWVAVHDAVRPLVTKALIEATIAAARKVGGAIAACPSKDTVKLAAPGSLIEKTPPRESVWLAHTPQVFGRELLERAHASHPELTATDDAQLVELLGAPVQLVVSPPENIKVTVPSDLVLARSILRQR
jgi:2-C-methyl-D-erythritol 4-phosphate cytidylyltransferase